MNDAPEDWLGLVGTTLQDKYVVERLVAEGGFSVVYRAQHAIWQQPVAVKVLTALSATRAEDHQRLLDEFVREGALLRELSSRTACILQAYDIATYQAPSGQSYPYLVLEWLEGNALDEVIRARRVDAGDPWSLDELVADMEPLAKALAVVHRRGISHRDIKPTNIFFVGYPRERVVKLLDFGIAKVVTGAAERGAAAAKTGGAISSFSPWYGAPEQFSRTYGATGPWTDVFAFALVLVEMLALRDPLRGETIPEVALQSTSLAVRPTPRTLGVTVSDAVEAVFARALAVAPTDRFETVGHLWSALREALGRPEATSKEMSMMGGAFANPGTDARQAFFSADTASRGSAPSFPPRTSAAPRSFGHDDTLPAPSPLPAATEPSSRNPSPLVFVAMAACVALGLGVAALIRQRHPAPTAAGSALVPAPPPLAAAGCPPGMALLPTGTFRMGVGEPSDGPAHDVTLSAFCLDRTEVTAEAYRGCQKNGECPPAPKRVDAADIPDGERDAFSALCTFHLPEAGAHPMNCVDYARAAQFCQAGKKRLPTSAEWEWAVRGPDDRPFPWGSAAPSATRLNACGTECTAWGTTKRIKLTALYASDDGYPATAPVGAFPLGASAEGILDLQGNVMEWVSDWDGPSKDGPLTDPTGPSSGEKRVLRGGVFTTESAAWLRPAFRFALAPESKSHGVGFRCASSASLPPR